MDKLLQFCGKFLKFALLTFTGVFIIVGIVWVLYAIFEWIYMGISYFMYRMGNGAEVCETKRTLTYSNGTTKCPSCHLQTPCGVRCSVCGAKLPRDQKLISYGKSKNTKEDDLDSADVSVVQYSERKKYQKIRCPYCNSLSRVIEEKYHGAQTRKCRNNHIFVYNYESEMLIQDELNAKYN